MDIQAHLATLFRENNLAIQQNTCSPVRSY
jgi:hypothetical protein